MSSALDPLGKKIKRLALSETIVIAGILTDVRTETVSVPQNIAH